MTWKTCTRIKCVNCTAFDIQAEVNTALDPKQILDYSWTPEDSQLSSGHRLVSPEIDLQASNLPSLPVLKRSVKHVKKDFDGIKYNFQILFLNFQAIKKILNY